MENRIQINGVWYVKEEEKQPDIDKKNIIYFKGAVLENEDYAWKATKIQKDDGSFYDGLDIEFIDKRKKPWKEEHWDNDNWFKGILDNNPDSMKEAKESMDDEGIKVFKAFLNKLVEDELL